MLEESKLKREMENAIFWISEFVEKAGAKGVVVGNSGGKDSAVVIAMATKALGKDRVLAVCIPCNSIAEDLEDARKVANKFDVEMIEVDITEGYNNIESEIDLKLQGLPMKELSKEAKINMKPRFRMLTLYSIAQTLGYLVIGTGNLCEAMVRIYNKMGG